MTRPRFFALVAAMLSACVLAGAAVGVLRAQASPLPTEFILDGFPEVIELRAEAPSADITDAALQLRLLPAGEPTIVNANLDGAQLSARILTAEPTAVWDWLPVGAELEYLWIIDGQPTPPGNWRYLDPRFDWGYAVHDGIAVWRPGSDLQAEQLVDHGAGAIELVGDLLETSVEQPVSLIVWPSSTAAAGGIPAALFGGQPPPIPRMTVAQRHGERIIYIFRDTGGSVRDAVTGAVIDAAAQPNAAAVPMWIRVALGLWSQGPMNGFYLRRAGSVVILDHEDYYSFEELETFPTTWQFQALYLGQSGGMLSWMLQDWGPPALIELFSQVGDGVDFYRALETVYGYDREQFIAEFTQNAERALLLTWPYIESETPPFWERLNIGLIMAIVVAVIAVPFIAYIGYRLLQ